MDEIFYIIVPCHNEENNIERFLTTANKELESFTNFRILFIDDGSTDNTWKKISELFDKNKFINGLKLSKSFCQVSSFNTCSRTNSVVLSMHRCTF